MSLAGGWGGVGREPPEHEKCALWGAFFVFSWSVEGGRGGGTAGEERVGVSRYINVLTKKKEPFLWRWA